jgi:hypothetical protein
MKKKTVPYCLVTASLFALGACTEPPPPTLAHAEREQVDSLFRMQVDSLKPLYDSLCTARHDSAVQFKADSMLTVRTAEIQQALERLRREAAQQQATPAVGGQ